ncbi:hypothetical protein ACKUFS_11605 [Pseudomonas cannabina]|uniref:hypothetical protein n=1 Tax=Pseudomonas syringae group TaxID=136849 RepID=UPI0006CC3312|nr:MULTISPECIES: hypothetical protein [Pseudomonas syringae group]KPB77923.1 Uncharacterized protein AC507_1632 [Pseudomonas syringae pv. maculicola]
MSKHPIPDWLRSQFSRIEDEVQKLGPCGVFTQMRTVTQTYFEQQAEAPQPPALGGEPNRSEFEESYRREFETVRGYPISIEEMESMRDGEFYGPDRAFLNGQWSGWQKCHRAHLAPLQVELTRMSAQFDELAAAVGFTKDRCEQAGDSPLDCANQLQAEIERLKDNVREVTTYRDNAIKKIERLRN